MDDDGYFELRAEMDSLDESVQELRDDLVTQEHSLADVRGLVGQMTAQLDWIEQQARTAGDGTGRAPVELDAVDDRSTQLARQIRAGVAARAKPLSDAERQDLLYRLQERQLLQTEHDRWLERALDYSRGLADRYDDETAGWFEHAEEKASELAAKVDSRSAADRTARDQLTQDDKDRRRADRAGKTEQRARSVLRDLLCERVSTAVANHETLPPWFTAALGHAPRVGTDASRWVDVAAEVVAYRIVYGIDHPLAALGSPPDDDAPGRQEWHTQILQRLGALFRTR